MDRAAIGGGKSVSAVKFSKWNPERQMAVQDLLACLSCDGEAYFVRRARNGRTPYFGSRNHADDCELATFGAESGGKANLPIVPAKANDERVFSLFADVPKSDLKHVEHDPSSASPRGRAGRHIGPAGTDVSSTGLGLNRLLRKLIRKPDYRNSRDVLVLDDNTRTTVAEYCALATDPVRRNVTRIYWGTIRYVSEEQDGAWFNIGRKGTPTIRLDADTLGSILARKKITDVRDLHGAAFAFKGPARFSEKSKRIHFFVKDDGWFTVRLPRQDPMA